MWLAACAVVSLVVNDEQLAVAADAEHDLVQLRVVVNAVHVVPELRNLHAGAVDINQFGMVGHHAVVVLGGIVVLDHVIPEMPFPDDRAAVGPRRRHFDEAVGQHVALGEDAGVEQVGVEAGGDDFGEGLLLGHEQEDVAVGQDLEVVVVDVGRAVVINRPDQVAVPIVFLDAPAFAAAGGGAAALDHAGAEHVAVGHQVGAAARLVGAGPAVDDLARVVDEVGVGVVHRGHQGVARPGVGGVEEQADGLRRGCASHRVGVACWPERRPDRC